MDVKRALTFMFEDPTWLKKLGVAVFFLTVPGVIAAVASQSLDSGFGILGFGAAGLITFVGGVLLYSHYSRSVDNIATNGADLPLPGRAPIGEMVERAVTQAIFHVALFITMIPLICIVGCPALFVAGAVGQGGGWVPAVISVVVIALTIGAAAALYVLLAFSRFIVTDQFGGSLNPGAVIRLFRESPGDWLTAAYLPAIVGLAISLVQMILTSAFPDDSVVDDVINTVVSTPISAFVTIVSFHLAGQAYRISVYGQQMHAHPCRAF